MLTRIYLVMLHVIFPIYLNFPTRSMCVFKAIMHRKKQWIVLQLFKNKILCVWKIKTSIAICVCCMLCSETFLSQDGVFQCSTGFTPKNFFLPTMVATFDNTSLIYQFWKNSSFFFWLMPCRYSKSIFCLVRIIN